MGDLNSNKKSRLRLKTLPFFLSSSNSKSQKRFGEEMVVGLGIVVALNNNNNNNNNNESSSIPPNPPVVFSASPRSDPIPIFSKRPMKDDDDDIEIELLEEYTCVISHVGNNLIKKKEYFDDGFETSYWVTAAGGGGGGGGGGVFCSPSPPPPVGVGGVTVFDGDFLSCCYLCKKKLHGLDIFMYRGEKAFCSEECRYKQISIDEHKDKYAFGMRKKPANSPCSSPMQLPAGMAAVA